MKIKPSSGEIQSIQLHSAKPCRARNDIRRKDELVSLSKNKSLSNVKTFLGNLPRFFLNIFCWPFHGISLLRHRIEFFIFFPVLLVFEVFYRTTNLVKSRFLNSAEIGSIGPSYKPKPTDGQLTLLKAFIEGTGFQKFPKKEQARLVYILDNYLTYIKEYNDSKLGRHNSYVNALIKVDVDGKTKLFKFKSHEEKDKFDDEKDRLATEYLGFLGEHVHTESKIKHTFISLDYAYFLGMFNLRVRTDALDYQLNRISTSEEQSQWDSKWDDLPFVPKINKRLNNQATNYTHFAFWPSYTKDFCCDIINRELGGSDLKSHQVSPTEANSLIQSVIAT